VVYIGDVGHVAARKECPVAAADPLAAFPPSLVRSVAREAARDADRVVAFLDAAGLTDRSLRLPRIVLLHLGAGLRLMAWEAAGVTGHRAEGIPAGRDVVVAALRNAARPDDLDPDLPVRVVGFHADRFSWDAPDLLDADVLLDALDGDDAAEAVAEFLWAARRRPAPPRADR